MCILLFRLDSFLKFPPLQLNEIYYQFASGFSYIAMIGVNTKCRLLYLSAFNEILTHLEPLVLYVLIFIKCISLAFTKFLGKPLRSYSVVQ